MSYLYVDYGSIHTSLKNSIITNTNSGNISSSGFKYASSEKWFNLEYGIFPDALKGQSFTIKFLSTEESDMHSVDWVDLNVGVEFLLDCNKYKYLQKIDNIHKSLDSFVYAAETSNQLMSRHNSNQFHWTSTYLQDKVLVSFVLQLTSKVRRWSPPK